MALLVAGINYVLEVEATLERVDSGDMSALNGYHDLQVSDSDCYNTTTQLPGARHIMG